MSRFDDVVEELQQLRLTRAQAEECWNGCEDERSEVTIVGARGSVFCCNTGRHHGGEPDEYYTGALATLRPAAGGPVEEVWFSRYDYEG